MVGITAVSRGFGAILAMSLPASAALSAQLRSAETVLQRALLVEAVEHTDARRSHNACCSSSSRCAPLATGPVFKAPST